MAVVRCPHCTLPLTDAEAGSGTCPACGADLRPGARPPAAPARGRADPAPARPAPWWPWAGGLLLLAVVVGASWLLSSPGSDAGVAPEARPALVRAAAAAPPPRPTVPAAARPGPGEGRARPRRGAEAPAAVKRPTAPADDTPLARPEPARRPDPPPGADPFPAGEEVHLDRPEGEYGVPALDRGARLRLTGRVARLRVWRVGGGSLLDASGLQAREVVFAGRIDGGSTVRLNAPGGSVEFAGPVEGRSRLEVHAPDGTVLFSRPPARGTPGSKIDGDSQVTITARAVEFRGLISGFGTRVLVTLTRGGRLRFRLLTGQVRLHYRKADPADPEPRVERGLVTGRAELRQLRSQ